jgi:hypothetical protein
MERVSIKCTGPNHVLRVQMDKVVLLVGGGKHRFRLYIELLSAVVVVHE